MGGRCGAYSTNYRTHVSLRDAWAMSPAVPWAKATRLPSKHRSTVLQNVQTPAQISVCRGAGLSLPYFSNRSRTSCASNS
jgi:hypothetical protein